MTSDLQRGCRFSSIWMAAGCCCCPALPCPHHDTQVLESRVLAGDKGLKVDELQPHNTAQHKVARCVYARELIATTKSAQQTAPFQQSGTAHRL